MIKQKLLKKHEAIQFIDNLNHSQLVIFEIEIYIKNEDWFCGIREGWRFLDSDSTSFFDTRHQDETSPEVEIRNKNEAVTYIENYAIKSQILRYTHAWIPVNFSTNSEVYFNLVYWSPSVEIFQWRPLFKRQEAVEFVNDLTLSWAIVLWWDVYLKHENKLYVTYDNWSISEIENESPAQYAERTGKVAVEYIENYSVESPNIPYWLAWIAFEVANNKTEAYFDIVYGFEIKLP